MNRIRAVTVVSTLAIIGAGTWLAHFLLTVGGCNVLGTWLYSACTVLLVFRDILERSGRWKVGGGTL